MIRSRFFVVLVVIVLGFSVSSFVLAHKNSKVTLTVFAASSLGQTFTDLGNYFEAEHPGVKVEFSFLASSTLATQLNAGAPADVFASASQIDMEHVKSLIDHPVLFAKNSVVLAVRKNDKFHINSFQDLNGKGVKWIQCAHVVPCGASADLAFAAESGVTSKPVSLEPKVSSVVAKLIAGEADAAIIFHSDYVAHADVLKEIRFTSLTAATTAYPIGVVSGSKNSALAEAFVHTVLSPYGRKVLAKAGFMGESGTHG